MEYIKNRCKNESIKNHRLPHCCSNGMSISWKKGIGESGLGNDAIEYNLKEYDDSTFREDTKATYGYNQPPTKMTPGTAVQDNVKYIIEKEPLLNRYNIDIDVFNDTVYLSGEVYSFEDKQRIEKLLSNPIIKKRYVFNE